MTANETSTANETLTAIADRPLVVAFIDKLLGWGGFTAIMVLVSNYVPWWLTVLMFVVIMGVWPQKGTEGNAHRVFNVGLFVLAVHVIPHTLLVGLGVLLVLAAPDDWYFEGYRETYREIEIYLSKVAVAQAQALFDQLGMEMTAIAIADHYTDMLQGDREPQYYRRFRGGLKRLCKTVLRQRETTPAKWHRGYDYITMQAITDTAVKAAIESDMRDRRKHRLLLEEAASVEYAA